MQYAVCLWSMKQQQQPPQPRFWWEFLFEGGRPGYLVSSNVLKQYEVCIPSRVNTALLPFCWTDESLEGFFKLVQKFVIHRAKSYKMRICFSYVLHVWLTIISFSFLFHSNLVFSGIFNLLQVRVILFIYLFNY